ncbi:MAG: ABC-F family ATP-binding cassette domain-containing protein [Aerococcus sp.]|nr:ABC-F family ATP-binding cassette domain-containing protein [Aerococcus sp.]
MRDYKAIQWNKTFGDKQLLNDVSFLIREGDHVGLVGANGSGKSTLLHLIVEKDDLDSGSTEHASDFTIGLVSQETELDPNQTIFEAVYAGDSPKIKVVAEYERATDVLTKSPNDPKCQDAFAKAEQAMNAQDGWQLDTQIHTILSQLGFDDQYAWVKNLSGGEQKRVGLAKVLVDEPDLLLLDEPTNHMDFEMVRWLENYIKNYKKSVMVVTHDRYFLDRVVSHIYALDRGELTEYTGNYQTYLEKKAYAEQIAQATQGKKKKLYKQELDWMRHGAKARTTKQQARIQRFNTLKESIKDKPQTDDLKLDFDEERLGKKVVILDDVSVGYDERHPLIKDINLLVQNQDRIGIIGNNGIGKTTLLNTIAGKIPPLEGDIAVGETVKMGYFEQIPVDLPADKRVINYIQEEADEYRYADGRHLSAPQMLETFLFPRERHGQYIGKLSGGEQKRLYLLRVLMGGANLLFMDEPTNDLDIDTLTVLEDYLTTFSGAVITVSHDRYFLDKVVDKLLIVKDNGQWELYYGNYSQWLEDTKAQKKAMPKSAKPKTVENTSATAKTSAKPAKKRMTYQEKVDWAVIEDEIDQLEMAISDIQDQMVANGDNYEKLATLQQEQDAKEAELMEKMEYWEYLSELAE